jgi:hypothetical protein
MDKYKYTTTFECFINPCDISENSFISKASLSNLDSLIPKGIDYHQNVDLVGVSFNAAVVNVFNKNGDGMDTDTALAFTKHFLHKPTNIEHNKEKIVGHIASAGFSDYSTNEILNEEELEGKDDPFNIALGAVLYRSANKDFVNLIERSADSEDALYKKISASWEVGFTEYDLILGSRNLKGATIISDAKQIEDLKPCLKAYGGTGKTKDGVDVFRLIKGQIFPLGIGFTTTPAANVKGIYAKDEEIINVNINDERDKNLKKVSQSENINVTTRKKNIMDLEKLVSELKVALIEKKFSEEAVASMTSTFADAIKQKDEQYRGDIEAVKTEKETLAKEYNSLKDSVETVKTELAQAKDKIESFEAAQKATEIIAAFNERMDIIDQKYDLDDADRTFLATELKSIELTEEAFASYQTKLSVLWKSKDKEVKASFEAEVQARINAEVEKRVQKVSTASTTSTEGVDTLSEEEKKALAEKALDNVSSASSGIPNSNETSSGQPQSLREKFAGAFKRENITIS